MACKAYYSTNSCTAGRRATDAPSFPRPPAPPQPGLLPLPLPPQYPFQPVSRPAPRASKKPRRYDAAPGASAPIAVAEPSKKRVAPATRLEEEWTEMADSLYSVSPPPSSVPMPTSLLLTVTAARTKAPWRLWPAPAAAWMSAPPTSSDGSSGFSPDDAAAATATKDVICAFSLLLAHAVARGQLANFVKFMGSFNMPDYNEAS